jgi:hypothetical protein
MFLELKSVRDYLQVQLRALIRAAKKKNIDFYITFKGTHKQTVTVTINNTGPFQEKTHFSLNIHACRDNHFCNFSIPINVSDPINIEDILIDTEKQLNNSPIVMPPLNKPEFSFKTKTDNYSDDQVESIDIGEYITWFKSRYLIDAPRKILFFTLLSRGFSFLGFMHDSCGFIFKGGSFCSANTKMRTRLCNFEHQVYANTLRELRLEHIRLDLQPYWNAKVKEYSSSELPETILFSAQCLMKFAYACLKSGSVKNKILWNWLTLVNHDDESHLHPLHCQIDHDPHPLLDNLKSQFNTWIHKEGQIDDSLDNLFKGQTQLFDEALYINDIHVSIQGNRITALSLGSSLYLSKNSPPNILNDSFQLDLEGEFFQSGSCSSMKRLLQMPNENLIEVPNFMILKEVNKQILLTASQSVG